MPGLTSFPALDVAIGLAFLYFVMSTGLSFLTFDVRQAEAARSLGFRVLGS